VCYRTKSTDDLQDTNTTLFRNTYTYTNTRHTEKTVRVKGSGSANCTEKKARVPAAQSDDWVPAL
jgi:hypothetical protein